LLHKWDFIREKKRIWELDAAKVKRARKVKQIWARNMQTRQILVAVYQKFLSVKDIYT
jgi:hypothetical protein